MNVGTNCHPARVLLDVTASIRSAVRAVSLMLIALVVLGGAGPVRASTSVSLLDLVEVDLAWTTIADHFDRPVTPQRLLDGARTGLIAELRARGIAHPQVAAMHAADAEGRGAVPAIDRQIALAIERYGKRVDTRGLVYAVIRGEVAALDDRYSVFFTASELHGFTRALDGASFGGIGVQLAFDPAAKVWRAESVFPGGPAAAAGIQPGDVIATVDGVALVSLADGRVTAALRGPVGSTVHLGIVRDGTPLAAPLAIVRATVTPPDVTEQLFPGNVGYVALHSFPLDAATQLRAALERLAGRGATTYVLDLRGNGGGYESAAVHVASLFIPSGTIASNHARLGLAVFSPADGHALPPAPLVVLVDGDSASGAELVAGALQDRKRGTLIGTRTFGKGVAQEMLPLPDGAAIKLTTMRYATAGGRFIDGIGLVPDIVVTEPDGAQRGVPGHDAQLDRALALLASGGMMAR
jgi:carboxyl-terminal processing protease